MIGGKFYGWTPPKKTTTNSSPTFGGIVSNFVNNWKPKEKKHPLTGASGTANTKTQSSTPVYGVDERRAQNNPNSSANKPKNTYVPSFWDGLKNLTEQSKKEAQATWQNQAARGGQIAAEAGTAGTQKPRTERPSSTPIVDVDARRAQLAAGYGTPGNPALDEINTDPVAVAREQLATYNDTSDVMEATEDTPVSSRPSVDPMLDPSNPGGTSGDEVFDLPTEEELAMERMRRLWTNRLARAASNAESAVNRLDANAEADYQGARRGVFNQARDYRRSLSGTGLGFSPRFTTAVRQAIQARANAEQAGRDRQNAERLFAIVSDLRNVRDTASEVLTDSELNALTDVSGRNLSNIDDSRLSNFFSAEARKARREEDNK